MKVEDGCKWISELRCKTAHGRLQLSLVLLTRRVPGGAIRPAPAHHLVAVDRLKLALRILNPCARRQDFSNGGIIIISKTDETARSAGP
jgi:hypothetical protein